MAKVNMYSVYDKVARQYGFPLMARNDDVAMRYYVDGLMKQKVQSSDFELYCVGTFDDDVGCVYGEVPRLVESAYKKAEDLTEVQ